MYTLLQVHRTYAAALEDPHLTKFDVKLKEFTTPHEINYLKETNSKRNK